MRFRTVLLFSSILLISTVAISERMAVGGWEWRLGQKVLHLSRSFWQRLGCNNAAPQNGKAPQESGVEFLTPSNRALTVWAVGDGTKVLEHDRPQARNFIWDYNARLASLHSAKNEYVAFQLVLTPQAEYSGVNIVFDELANGDNRIGKGEIALFRQWYTEVKSHQRPGSTGDGRYPDALIPFFDPFVVMPSGIQPAGSNKIYRGSEDSLFSGRPAPEGATSNKFVVMPSGIQPAGSTKIHGGPEDSLFSARPTPKGVTTNKPVAAPFNLVPGKNQPIWIDIHVPAETAAGDYFGKLFVIAKSDTLERLAVKLTVWNFTLPNETHLEAFADLYGARFAKGESVPWQLSTATWKILRQYEIMAHEHRFVNGHWGLEPSTVFDQNGSLLKTDWRTYDHFLGQVLDGTLFDDKTPPSFWEAPIRENWRRSLTEADKNAIRAYCAEIERHFLAKNWPVDSTFVYTIDEPKEFDFPTIRQYSEAVKSGSRRLQFMLTYPVSDPLKLHVDLWAIFAGTYYPPHVQAEQQAGKKAWFYQSYAEPFLGLETLDTYGLAFRTWAWIAWKYGSDGVFFWASNFWTDSPYHQLDGHRGDGEGLLFYPGRKLPQIGLAAIDGPVSSLRMKQLRRGLQDYEYLWLLQQAGLKHLADEAVNDLIQSALCQQYDPHGRFEEGAKYAGWWEDRRYPQLEQWEKDPRPWYEIHRRLGEALHQK